MLKLVNFLFFIYTHSELGPAMVESMDKHLLETFPMFPPPQVFEFQRCILK